MVSYSIIFIVILIIIFVIMIILIVYANRDNIQNLLASLPNYRIQHVASGTYLGLMNINENTGIGMNASPVSTLSNPNPPPPSPFTGFDPFWSVFVRSGVDNAYPLGLWKIDTIKTINNKVSEVKIINTVYNLESTSNSGFLGATINIGTSDAYSRLLRPIFKLDNSSTFTLTLTDINTFTLSTNGFSVFIEKTNTVPIGNSTNILRFSDNPNIKPDVFKLVPV